MDAVPVVRRRAFLHVTSTLSHLGCNVDRMLSSKGIGAWHHGHPNDWIPFSELLNGLEVGASTVGDPRFGIAVSEYNMMEFGPVARAITNSVSLYDGLRQSALLVNRINSTANIWLASGVSNVWFCRAPTSSFLMEQYVLGHMIGLVRLAAGDRWKPKRVHLTAARDHGLSELHLFANTEIRTGQKYLAIPVPKSELSDQIVADFGFEELSSPAKGPGTNPPPNDFVGSLRRILESVVVNRSPTIENISECLQISKRTLQRELAKEGLTYREIVGQVRYLLSRDLLNLTDIPIREIACELSYSSEAHFIRAFRHWAGITPGEYRKHRILKPSDPNYHELDFSIF